MADNIHHDLALRPNADTMREQLYALFRYSMRGLVEIGWTDKDGALNRAKQFDVGDLDDLVTFACRINDTPNTNVYISAGLRRTDMDRDHRATDADVISIAAVKVDCDTAGCMEAALPMLKAAGLTPTLAHYSGRHPSLRGALWWVLDEPEPDLQRVRAIDTALSYWLNTDRKVVNASRVMRLPGSIAWPLKAGRVKEMTGVYATETRPAPYTIEEIESALRRAGKDPATAGNHVGADVLDFSSAKQSHEIESLLAAASTPNEWHNNALLATAHLWRRDCPADVIIDLLAPRLTLPGYSEIQTRRELAVMLDGAERKWGAQKREHVSRETPYQIPTPDAGQRDPFPLISVNDMGLQGPPAWRIKGFIPEKGFGVLYGPSGAFKSFIALDLALTVAYGLPWRGHATEAAGAAYIAGEGTYGIQNRVIAWRTHRGRDKHGAPFWLAPVAANFLDPATVKLVAAKLQPLNTKLIVVDTLARSFGGGDENSTQDMNRFVAACDYLKEMCGAFVLAIHHTGVSTTERARGSSALKAAADVELSVARGIGEASVTLSVTKMKDAEDGARVSVRMVPVDGVFAATGEVVTSLVPVLSEEQPVTKPASKMGRNERSVMTALSSVYPVKFTDLRAAIGIDSGSLGRALRSLQARGFVTVKDDLWEPVSGVYKNE